MERWRFFGVSWGVSLAVPLRQPAREEEIETEEPMQHDIALARDSNMNGSAWQVGAARTDRRARRRRAQDCARLHPRRREIVRTGGSGTRAARLPGEDIAVNAEHLTHLVN
jgi:hypothetical protein